ncbi:unnamed protein product [Camellia sinensis]
MKPCTGILDRETFSTKIIENISLEDLQPTVQICIDGLQSPSIAVKRSAAAKLRLLSKNRSDDRALIGGIRGGSSFNPSAKMHRSVDSS